MEIDALQIGIGALIGFICSFLVKESFIERKIRRLEAENDDLDEQCKNLQNTLNGREGLNARKDKAERMQGMMLEFANAMQAPDAKPQEIIKLIATKYPDIAMDLVKKGMKMV